MFFNFVSGKRIIRSRPGGVCKRQRLAVKLSSGVPLGEECSWTHCCRCLYLKKQLRADLPLNCGTQNKIRSRDLYAIHPDMKR